MDEEKSFFSNSPPIAKDEAFSNFLDLNNNFNNFIPFSSTNNKNDWFYYGGKNDTGNKFILDNNTSKSNENSFYGNIFDIRPNENNLINEIENIEKGKSISLINSGVKNEYTMPNQTNNNELENNLFQSNINNSTIINANISNNNNLINSKTKYFNNNIYQNNNKQQKSIDNEDIQPQPNGLETTHLNKKRGRKSNQPKLNELLTNVNTSTIINNEKPINYTLNSINNKEKKSNLNDIDKKNKKELINKQCLYKEIINKEDSSKEYSKKKKNLDELIEVKKEKNRLSAKKCRNKKKEYLKNLELLVKDYENKMKFNKSSEYINDIEIRYQNLFNNEKQIQSLNNSQNQFNKQQDDIKASYRTNQKSLLNHFFYKQILIMIPIDCKLFQEKFLKLSKIEENDSIDVMLNKVNDNIKMLNELYSFESMIGEKKEIKNNYEILAIKLYKIYKIIKQFIESYIEIQEIL